MFGIIRIINDNLKDRLLPYLLYSCRDILQHSVVVDIKLLTEVIIETIKVTRIGQQVKKRSV